MNETLLAMQAILVAGLIDDVLTEDRIVKAVQCRPEAWIRANLKTLMYPAVYVWADGEEFIQGRDTRSKTRLVRAVVSVLTSSVDINAALNSNRSAHAIGQTVRELLEQNKRLIVDNTQYADGLTLPIKSQAYQYKDQGAFYAIGWATMYTYRRFGINWVSEANPSNN